MGPGTAPRTARNHQAKGSAFQLLLNVIVLIVVGALMPAANHLAFPRRDSTAAQCATAWLVTRRGREVQAADNRSDQLLGRAVGGYDQRAFGGARHFQVAELGSGELRGEKSPCRALSRLTSRS